MDERVLNAALAGLLHDLGKFSQRAGRGKNEIWDKETRGAIKYEHALASYGFVQQFVPKDWRAGLSGVAYHHRPQTLADRWIQLADWMSSAERLEDEDTKAPYLRTIFSRVGGFDTPSYWPLGRLNYTDEKAIFAGSGDAPEWKEAHQQKYAGLWDDFERECQRRGVTAATTFSKVAYLENLLAVLQEFTWNVPSAYWKSVPDVSLFDHLRTTAALAACLAADERDENWCKTVEGDLTARRTSQPMGLLVGGDFSGIQDFIYTLASSGAAKSLRARSFYLQLLGEVIALNVLDTLGLPLTNLLYVGGGGFQLLAPMNAKDSLIAFERSLTDKLMEAHRGALGLTLTWVTVQADEFARFGEVRERMGQKLSDKKRRPFAWASTAQLAQQVGRRLTLGGDPRRFCRVTGDDWDVQRDKQGEYKTGFVRSLEELGRRLPYATHLVLSTTTSTSIGRPRTWQEGLNLFGYQPTLVTDKDLLPEFQLNGIVQVWRLDPRNVGKEAQLMGVLKRQAEIALADRPIAKLVPLDDDGELLTFDELAEKQARGIKRWGVLRLDVDNLGTLFREGLGVDASLSRLASLSFGLHLFFEGWLPELAGTDLSDKLYIQYSGGDDVFVVGAWDALPEFALRIHDAFQKFTGGNPAFTLSGGIAVVDANFPLYQAARMAGEAEELAKELTRPDGRAKDAVRFLGHTCEWAELKHMSAEAEQLAGWTKTRVIPAALLQVVQSLYGQIKQAEKAAREAKPPRPKPKFGRWMWMAAYQITRVLQNLRGKNEEVESAKKKIEAMQTTFLIPGAAEAERLGLTARWAQLLARGEK